MQSGLKGNCLWAILRLCEKNHLQQCMCGLQGFNSSASFEVFSPSVQLLYFQASSSEDRVLLQPGRFKVAIFFVGRLVCILALQFTCCSWCARVHQRKHLPGLEREQPLINGARHHVMDQQEGSSEAV